TADRVRALESGADDYMTKPVDRMELVARVGSALRLKAVYDSLDSAEHVIFALAAAVEAKDPYTEAHTQRVAESARRIGSSLGLPSSDLEALYRGGLIHDIGKIGVPDAILLKPGPLDSDEMTKMQRHPIIGANIVAPLRSGATLLPIIRNHHEHFDGTGYPDRLSGAGIPRLARIVSVSDAFDALVNDRPYRQRKSVDEALACRRDRIVGGSQRLSHRCAGTFRRQDREYDHRGRLGPDLVRMRGRADRSLLARRAQPSCGPGVEAALAEHRLRRPCWDPL